MNLITKLIEKLKAKQQFDFENFDKNFKHNKSLAEKKLKKMQRGANKLIDKSEIKYYVVDPLGEIETIKSALIKQTNSESFSFNFAHIVVCAKLYAANYIATDEGKKYKDIKFACERLCEMVDFMNFNFMAHVNCETEYTAKFKDDLFTVDPNSYASRLIEMINAVNNTMMDVAEGIYNRNRDDVYAGFLSLSDTSLYKFEDDVKELLGL